MTSVSESVMPAEFLTRSTMRCSELDLIRTSVVIGLVFFHAALVFDANDDC